MRSVNLTLALLCAVLPALAAGTAEEARTWIKRMNEAVVNRNYEGVLEHRWAGGGYEALHLIHRMQDGNMAERVVFLGSNNEITRNGSKYVEYDRRKGIAKGQTLNRSYGYLAAFNEIGAASDSIYRFSVGGTQLVQAYQTQIITVMPTDAYRYGYRFWLDQKSALPVRTQLVSASGNVIDDISFRVLTLRDSIPDESLKPALSPAEEKRIRWVTPKISPTEVRRAFLPRQDLLPPGFRLRKVVAAEKNPPASMPESRFMVSDGVSWVSVLVSVADRPLKEGLHVESASAFSFLLQLDGHYISVGGEVPPATVEAIARAIRPE